MKWKKILSFAIVSVLVIGGFAVISGHTRAEEEGELVDTINIEVTLQMESGVGAVYDGELHLFMQSVDGLVYQGLPRRWREELSTWTVRGSYNSMLINPAREGNGTAQMQDAIDAGWIEDDDPDNVQWLANDVGGDWTVNPYAHEAIRFAMVYMNRQEIVEDLMDGFGGPRYGFMSADIPIWTERMGPYFQENLVDKVLEFEHGGETHTVDVGELEPQGDDVVMETIVEHAMLEIQEHVEFGEVTGSLDGWYYEAPDGDEHQIEIKIIARVEDWRLDLGHYLSDVLGGLGFDAWVEPIDGATAIPMAFFGTPEPYDNLDYHIYTGGWISTATVYYQDAAAAQMHAPWYGFMQTYNSEDRWNYDEEGYTERVQRLDEVSERAFLGLMETEDEYWDLVQEGAWLGFEEAVRVFLTTGIDFFPYDPDRLISAVTEATNGYDTYFGPRTMFTEDGNLDAAILTGEDRPYMDNWNIHGGSSDVYGEYSRRMAREWNTWNHPRSGIPMPVNVYWMDQETFNEEWPERTYPYEEFDGEGPLDGDIEYNYEFTEEDELEEYIPIPDDAVDYFPEEEQWKTVDEYIEEENRTAAIRVKYDVHEEHEWHDGTDFDVQDLMWNYARVKRLGTETGDGIYDSEIEAANLGWWGSIHAMEWDRDEGTYTVYGDYTFPVEPKGGQQYAISVETNQWAYEAFDYLHAGDYDYAGRGGQTWHHQLSSVQMEDVLAQLDEFKADGYVPEYLDADNMPADHPLQEFAMDATEAETQIDSVQTFIETYDHCFIGMGPYVITDYDTDTHEMKLEKFENYGWPDGYWTEQFLLQEPRIDSVEAPRAVAIGDEFDINAEAHMATDYPTPAIDPLTEDDLDNYRFVVLDADREEILTVESDDIELTEQDTFSDFVATEIEADVETGGHYVLQFQVLEEGAANPVTMDTMIILYDPDVDLTVTDWTIPDVVQEGDTDNIRVEIENLGDEEDTAYLHLVDELTGEEEVIDQVDVPAGDTAEIDLDYTFDELGYYDVEIYDDEDRFVDNLGNIEVQGSDVLATGLTVAPIYGEPPLEVTIDMLAANTGNVEGTIDLMIDGVAEETYTVSGFGSISPSTTYTFDEEGVYTISFGELEQDVTVTDIELDPVDLTVPDELVKGEEGTITAEVENTVPDDIPAYIYVDGVQIHEEMIPAEETVEFSVDHTFDTAGEIDVDLVDNRDITMMTDTVTVLDLFELTVNVQGEGEVEITPDQDEYVEGEDVTLTADPDEGWYFEEWTGDYPAGESEEETITITMDSDKTLTAVFEEEVVVEEYTLTINIDGEGTVEVDGVAWDDGDSDTFEAGTEVDLEAIPDDDWEFDEWQGTDETGEEITITMDEDMDITAVFEEEEEETPGFTLALLILGAVVAVAIYYKKEQ